MHQQNRAHGISLRRRTNFYKLGSRQTLQRDVWTGNVESRWNNVPTSKPHANLTNPLNQRESVDRLGEILGSKSLNAGFHNHSIDDVHDHGGSTLLESAP